MATAQTPGIEEEDGSAAPKAGFKAAPPANDDDEEAAALERDRLDFLAYLAACFFPEKKGESPKKLFMQEQALMLNCFDLTAKPDINAVAAGREAIPVRMKVSGNDCLIEVKRDSILTQDTLTMEAALEMALLALSNPAMKDGVELTGTDEEKMILYTVAQKAGLKVINPPG